MLDENTEGRQQQARDLLHTSTSAELATLQPASDLPAEIWWKIFSYLPDAATVEALASTSKTFRSLIFTLPLDSTVYLRARAVAYRLFDNPFSIQPVGSDESRSVSRLIKFHVQGEQREAIYLLPRLDQMEHQLTSTVVAARHYLTNCTFQLTPQEKILVRLLLQDRTNWLNTVPAFMSLLDTVGRKKVLQNAISQIGEKENTGTTKVFALHIIVAMLKEVELQKMQHVDIIKLALASTDIEVAIKLSINFVKKNTPEDREILFDYLIPDLCADVRIKQVLVELLPFVSDCEAGEIIKEFSNRLAVHYKNSYTSTFIDNRRDIEEAAFSLGLAFAKVSNEKTADTIADALIMHIEKQESVKGPAIQALGNAFNYVSDKAADKIVKVLIEIIRDGEKGIRMIAATAIGNAFGRLSFQTTEDIVDQLISRTTGKIGRERDALAKVFRKAFLNISNVDTRRMIAHKLIAQLDYSGNNRECFLDDVATVLEKVLTYSVSKEIGKDLVEALITKLNTARFEQFRKGIVAGILVKVLPYLPKETTQTVVEALARILIEKNLDTLVAVDTLARVLPYLAKMDNVGAVAGDIFIAGLEGISFKCKDEDIKAFANNLACAWPSLTRETTLRVVEVLIKRLDSDRDCGWVSHLVNALVLVLPYFSQDEQMVEKIVNVLNQGFDNSKKWEQISVYLEALRYVLPYISKENLELFVSQLIEKFTVAIYPVKCSVVNIFVEAFHYASTDYFKEIIINQLINLLNATERSEFKCYVAHSLIKVFHGISEKLKKIIAEQFIGLLDEVKYESKSSVVDALEKVFPYIPEVSQRKIIVQLITLLENIRPDIVMHSLRNRVVSTSVKIFFCASKELQEIFVNELVELLNEAPLEFKYEVAGALSFLPGKVDQSIFWKIFNIIKGIYLEVKVQHSDAKLELNFILVLTRLIKNRPDLGRECAFDFETSPLQDLLINSLVTRGSVARDAASASALPGLTICGTCQTGSAGAVNESPCRFHSRTNF